MSLFKMFADFIWKVLPILASGIGYTMITAFIVLSAASNALKIATFFLEKCQ